MGVLDSVKEVADLVKKIGDIDLYRKIVSAEDEVMELTRQLRLTQERVRELEGILSLKKKLAFKVPFYFADGDPIPYCPRCWEVEQKTLHMVLRGAGQARYASYDCPECKKSIPLSGPVAKYMPPDAGSPEPYGF
jgi:hypothetical protein